MIAIGEALPSLRCFVAGTRATDLREIEPGDHLVVYIAGAGVISSALDEASRWPLPTLPRTAFAIVDHASAFHGFLRTHTVEDVALTIRRALDPPANGIRAVVVSPDRTVRVRGSATKLEGESCFDGDVVGEVAVVKLVGPRRQGFVCDGEDVVDVFFAPGAAGVAQEELDHASSTDTANDVRIGIASSQELQWRVVGKIATKHAVPTRSEQLQMGI